LSKTSNQYQFINWRAGSSEALLEEKKKKGFYYFHEISRF
jgi:hypothetical protein